MSDGEAEWPTGLADVRTDRVASRAEGDEMGMVAIDDVSPGAIIVDTALSTEGAHDIADGRAWLVRFDGGLGEVVVSARYTEADEDDARDIAADIVAERRADLLLGPDESDAEDARAGRRPVDLVARALDAIESVARISVRS